MYIYRSYLLTLCALLGLLSLTLTGCTKPSGADDVHPATFTGRWLAQGSEQGLIELHPDGTAAFLDASGRVEGANEIEVFWKVEAVAVGNMKPNALNQTFTLITRAKKINLDSRGLDGPREQRVSLEVVSANTSELKFRDRLGRATAWRRP